MEDHKVRAEYREKGRKRKEAELIDMEKHPSPMSESFRRPARWNGAVSGSNP